MTLEHIINLDLYPIADKAFQKRSRRIFDRDGVFIMPGFLTESALAAVHNDGMENQDKARFITQQHNVYLTDPDPDYPDNHPRNREVVSSKGCITDDQIPENSALKTLYNAPDFKDFLSYILTENALYPYADRLSSINLHYAKPGQELGWHFDNSSFAITLMIQSPDTGGEFEYVRAVRDADKGEMNFKAVEDVLTGKTTPHKLSVEDGALVMFRGRNAMHRVAPNDGSTTRMLVVLAYNTEPDISLSESARMTFYGRL